MGKNKSKPHGMNNLLLRLDEQHPRFQELVNISDHLMQNSNPVTDGKFDETPQQLIQIKEWKTNGPKLTQTKDNVGNKNLTENARNFPAGDSPPYSKHKEQGIPVSLQQGSCDPIISNLLKVICEKNKNSAPQWNTDTINPIHQNEKTRFMLLGGLEVISVHNDDTTSLRGTPSEKLLTYCWTCDTPGHLGKPCSSMDKDPDFRPVNSNILCPHKKKRHMQELLREVKEQMNHEAEAMLDNRLPTTNDKLDENKWTSDPLDETLNPNDPTPTSVPSEQIDLTLDHQLQALIPEISNETTGRTNSDRSH